MSKNDKDGRHISQGPMSGEFLFCAALAPVGGCMFVTLIPACISNYVHYELWDEIFYPFPNFNGAIVEICECLSNFIPLFIMDVITYSCWDYKVNPC